jgi:hypothetical protein
MAGETIGKLYHKHPVLRTLAAACIGAAVGVGVAHIMDSDAQGEQFRVDQECHAVAQDYGINLDEEIRVGALPVDVDNACNIIPIYVGDERKDRIADADEKIVIQKQLDEDMKSAIKSDSEKGKRNTAIDLGFGAFAAFFTNMIPIVERWGESLRGT